MNLPDKFILLVEDNYNDELLTRRAFRKNHLEHQLMVARDGVEALDFLLHAATLPALVLLDLKLPRMDGFELLGWLRAQERTRQLPVIVLTSSDEQEDVRRAISCGIHGYARKPVDLSEFVEMVRQWGLCWLPSDASLVGRKIC